MIKIAKTDRFQPKCEYCGKFVKNNSDEVIVTFTPDTDFTVEDIAWAHIECINKLIKKVEL